MKKLVIAGGTGFLGTALINHFKDSFDEIVVLGRGDTFDHPDVTYIQWNAKTLGLWVQALEHTNVLINMCGKSVDCRYNKRNKFLILDSRLRSTQILADGINQLDNPPKLWINSSSATIYKHATDKAQTEEDGIIGDNFSERICKQWEKTFFDRTTPHTRKVAVRSSLVLGKEGGVYPVLAKMTKNGFGGTQGNGEQFVSWIHIDDFLVATEFIMSNRMPKPVYNICAPNPIQNQDFMELFRNALHKRFGLNAKKWMLEIGAFFMRTETELILKSRRVVPLRLQQEGFQFKYNTVEQALDNLVK